MGCDAPFSDSCPTCSLKSYHHLPTSAGLGSLNLQLPPPPLFSQPHLLGAVSSSSITRKAGQMPQGTFSWQSREKTGIWAHGKSRAQGKKASTPLAGVGAWGRSGCSQGPHLARPPWSCCGHSCCASPRLHVSLGSRWPPQHFTWVWHHSGHWQR